MPVRGDTMDREERGLRRRLILRALAVRPLDIREAMGNVHPSA